MKEERLFILKMVDEGKISADEGVKLLRAVGGGDGKGFRRADVEEKLAKAVKTVDAFAKEVKLKVEDFAKDAEPKVKEASRFVLDKTTVAFDEIGKAIRNVIDTTSKNDDKFDVVVEDKTELEEKEK